jgi:hypothetical protein
LFSFENFGNIPVILILDCLKHTATRHREKASLFATPIARLGEMLQPSLGYKSDFYIFNPAAKLLLAEFYRSEIPCRSAQVIMYLYKTERLPPWLVTTLDLPAWKMAAEVGHE